MKTFPMFVQMAGRRVVILGGGEEAAQKVRLFSKTEAELVVASTELVPELQTASDEGRITHHAGGLTREFFEGAALVVIGTGCCMNDRVLHLLAKDFGALVNVVDRPALCDAITPSIVDRDPVVVAIGTEGAAPVLGQQIKRRVDAFLEPNLGALTAHVGALRPRVAEVFDGRARRDFYRWVFEGPPRQLHAAGDADAALAMIEDALTKGSWTAPEGSIAVVEAVPGTSDLISLRGVARLQAADRILYAPQLTEYLDLARRDAEREAVGDWESVAAEEGETLVCLVEVGQGLALTDHLHAELIKGP
ncbi:NAD(P)-dependent oxidoreductase [Pseudaestuariivita sp.]|uniref:NAD(P)-dependent oxidoreductase n=1 Tax=Pseudaestuariivita sp. TaxID=2211669 RepID=UPI004059CF36